MIELKQDKEREVKCDTCNKQSIMRELAIHYPGGMRMVSYFTHESSIDSKKYIEVLGRLRIFHERLLRLQEECNKLNPKEGQLEFGNILNIEIESKTPTACEFRTFVRIVLTTSMFGKVDNATGDWIELTGLTKKNVLTQCRELANPIIIQRKYQRERGEI
jgi:hypothetical protein